MHNKITHDELLLFADYISKHWSIEIDPKGQVVYTHIDNHIRYSIHKLMITKIRKQNYAIQYFNQYFIIKDFSQFQFYQIKISYLRFKSIIRQQKINKFLDYAKN